MARARQPGSSLRQIDFSARYPERQAKGAAGELRLAARVDGRPGILVWPEFGRISVACGAILKYHPSKA